MNRKIHALLKPLSKHIYEINSSQRKVLHLAAVLANNFSNHLFALSSRLLKDHGMTPDLLKPLILETAKKVQKHSPEEMQTGPAIRGDVNVIDAHLELLKGQPQLEAIYKLLTSSIENLRGSPAVIFLYTCAMDPNFKSQLNSIRCLVFDVDGVLTDGTLIVTPDELYRTMNIRDGYAIRAAIDASYLIFIISGGKSESVHKRLEQLGVKEIHMGISDKKEKLLELMETYKLHKDQVLYMGDDLPDYEVMQMAGVRTCPNDAAPEIKALCTYISPVKGGRGCGRDIIEQVMRLHGKWWVA